MRFGYSPSKVELLGIALVSAVVTMALFSYLPDGLFGAPSKSPYSPPSLQNLLGTNDIGEDVFSVLLRGSRVSLTIGFLGAAVSTLIGTLIGIIAGSSRGILDDLLGSLTDLFLVVPALPLMIVLAAYLGPSFINVVAVIGLLWWPTTARLVRARARQVTESLFVEGLIGIGARKLYIIFRHILPNVLGIVFARFVLAVSSSILLEAGLSFIGLGDPQNPSWGTMLHFAMTRGALLYGAWWTFIPPGFCISLTSLGFILIGMGIEHRISSGTKSVGGFA
ncbi:MAG: ABC transporter permease [Candidatus Methanosuratincola sp.]|jgi:peptide/nickel transport system permease protein|nr:ABC transporter permease [Candidatus Methanosuratincola sp.]